MANTRVWSNKLLEQQDSLAVEMQEVLAFYFLPNKTLISTLTVLCDLIKKKSKGLKIKEI